MHTPQRTAHTTAGENSKRNECLSESDLAFGDFEQPGCLAAKFDSVGCIKSMGWLVIVFEAYLKVGARFDSHGSEHIGYGKDVSVELQEGDARIDGALKKGAISMVACSLVIRPYADVHSRSRMLEGSIASTGADSTQVELKRRALGR